MQRAPATGERSSSVWIACWRADQGVPGARLRGGDGQGRYFAPGGGGFARPHPRAAPGVAESAPPRNRRSPYPSPPQTLPVRFLGAPTVASRRRVVACKAVVAEPQSSSKPGPIIMDGQVLHSLSPERLKLVASMGDFVEKEVRTRMWCGPGQGARGCSPGAGRRCGTRDAARAAAAAAPQRARDGAQVARAHAHACACRDKRHARVALMHLCQNLTNPGHGMRCAACRMCSSNQSLSMLL